MKKLLTSALLALASVSAWAQFTPGQLLTATALNNQFALYLPLAGGTLTGPLSVPSVTISGTGSFGTLASANAIISGGTIFGLSSPIPVASGGTNSASASGTALDNITGFSSTGFLTRTGAGTYAFQSLTNGISLGNLAQAPANTVLSNATGATANVSAFAMPGCSAAGSALNWTAGSGFGCVTGLIGSATLGTGVQTALGVAANASGGVPLVNGSVSSGSCLQWSSSGLVDSGAPCYDPKVVTVTKYGALGNSNGTHGNGNDDTTAFQNAFNAGANGSIIIPCGTYRLTSTITVTDNLPRHIYGHGACTKIFSDASTAITTWSFSPSSGTCSSAQFQPCIVIRDLTFITPNTLGGNQGAIGLNNENASRIEGVNFVAQNVGISLTNSYAVRMLRNGFFGGAYGIYSTDTSLNGGEIGSNGFYAMTGSAVYLAPSSGCAEGLNIRNNDIEQVSTSLYLGGMCGGSVDNNYIENAHTQALMTFGGSGQNSSIRFNGNTLNGATDSGAGTLTIANVVNAQFTNNYFLNVNVSYGSGVSKVRLRALENSTYATTLPATTVACTGLGTGGTCSVTGDDYAGQVALTSGSASTGSTGGITVTFSNAIGSNGSSCTLLPVNGTANWSTPTLIGSSQGTTSNGINWTNSTALTASKVYFAAYQCLGY